MTIENAFQPLIMERVMLALRNLLNTEKLVITDVGTYDGKNVVIGARTGTITIPFALYFNQTPTVYAGSMKTGWFPKSHYIIDKSEHPPFNYDGSLVRFEECLPNKFQLKDETEDLLGYKATNKFKHMHRDRWHRVSISTKDLVAAVRDNKIRNLWSWTYEINMNNVTGTNVIYCRKKRDAAALMKDDDHEVVR